MVWFYLSSLFAVSVQFWKLSIPLWSDFIPVFTDVWVLFQCVLSIPLWSDFIIHSWRVILCSTNFQSHYGLILSYTKNNDLAQTATYLTFQSHYGLILSISNSKSNKVLCTLSIPLWSDFIILSAENTGVREPSFNPTMVWFYQHENSTKKTTIFQSFNPTMVWFYRVFSHAS